MEIWEVLVINDGLSNPCYKVEKWVQFHHCGLQDVTSWEYRAIVLQWINGIVIKSSSSYSSDLIISTDIHRAIQKIREKMSWLNTPDGVPIIIESRSCDVAWLKTLSPLETNFLVRRILSGNISDNKRNIALVNPPDKSFNSQVRADAQMVSERYPHLIFQFWSPFNCLYDIAEGKSFDSISLFHRVWGHYPKLLTKKLIIGEDTRAYFQRITQYSTKKSPDVTSVIKSCQTACPHTLINEFWEGCSRHHIECLEVHTFPKLDIPDFLDKCQKI